MGRPTPQCVAGITGVDQLSRLSKAIGYAVALTAESQHSPPRLTVATPGRSKDEVKAAEHVFLGPEEDGESLLPEYRRLQQVKSNKGVRHH